MNEKEKMLAARALFRPKLPELPEQCVSCPFRSGNDKEFSEICVRLAMTRPEDGPPAPVTVARARIRMETTLRGEFICHGTAYTRDMALRPQSDHKQCPGATKWFKTHLPPIARKR